MATLKEVNARLPRQDIKGKPYVMVNAKVLGFRELYPGGRIVTRKLSDDGARCDFIAEAWDGERLLATGHAYETRNAGMVNKTSYVENCETSAVGRALAFLGIGAEDSIASYEEVSGAIVAQEGIRRLDEAKKALWTACKRLASQQGTNPRGHWDALLGDRPLDGWTAEELLELAAQVEAEVV